MASLLALALNVPFPPVAFVDTRCADFAIEMLEQMSPLERYGAVHLDGHIDHLLCGLRCEQLRHGRAPGYPLVAAIVRFGGSVDERARGFEPRRHLSELV